MCTRRLPCLKDVLDCPRCIDAYFCLDCIDAFGVNPLCRTSGWRISRWVIFLSDVMCGAQLFKIFRGLWTDFMSDFHEQQLWKFQIGDYLWYLLLQANISLMLLSQAYIYFPSTAHKCDGLLWPKKRVADSSNQLVTNLSFLLALLVTRQMPFLTLSLLNDDECTHPKLCLLNYRLWM